MEPDCTERGAAGASVEMMKQRLQTHYRECVFAAGTEAAVTHQPPHTPRQMEEPAQEEEQGGGAVGVEREPDNEQEPRAEGKEEEPYRAYLLEVNARL